MYRIRNNYLPHIAITILTVIAVMVNFSLPVRAAGSGVDQIGGACYYFPEQAGNPALFAKSDDNRNSLFRVDFQKLFSPWGMNGVGYTFLSSRVKINAKFDSVNIKDTIPLKLRT